MALTIELPDALGAALKAQAEVRGVSVAGYARQVLEEALASKASGRSGPLKTGIGLLAKYGPAPSAEEIDANRAEMFSGFAKD